MLFCVVTPNTVLAHALSDACSTNHLRPHHKLNCVNNNSFISVNSLQITFCIADMRVSFFSDSLVNVMAESLEAVK